MKLAMLAVALATGFVAGRLGCLPQAAPAETPVMERVTGIGGVFFKAKDPAALGAWYQTHLGLAIREGGHTFHVFEWRQRDDPARTGSTVWSVFRADTKYFEPGRAPFMINYRVRNLDAMLAQLRRMGVVGEGKISEEFNGRFAWLSDPEGNRIELWEPKEGY